MAGPCYRLFMPRTWAVPLVLSAPHAGVELPHGFALPKGRTGQAVAALSDRHIDQLAAPAAGALGFPLLASRYLRAFIDLNRSPEDLDPLLIDDLPAAYQTIAPGSRVAAGLGIIPRLAEGQRPIYARPISYRAAASRIDRFYRPFHEALAGLIDRCLDHFGLCLLVDLHSMPPIPLTQARRHLAQSPVRRAHPHKFPGTGLNMVLGDDFGRSLAAPLSADLLGYWQGQGLTISYNAPYAGGSITANYGQRVPTVQLEVCRRIYPDQGPRPQAKTLERLFLGFAAFAADQLRPMRNAAE